jgi:hypothetical protein
MRRRPKAPRRLESLLLAALMLPMMTAPPYAAETGWVNELLAFLGVTASPSLQKGAEEGFSGDIYLARFEADGASISKIKHRVTRDGIWRWPIFSGDGRSILAIDWADNVLVRLSPKTGQRLDQWRPGQDERFVKLIGAREDEPLSVLAVIEGPAGPRAAAVMLAAQDAEIRPIPIPKDSKFLTHLYQSKRVYGEREVRTVLGASDKSGATNVEFRSGPDAVPINASGCTDRDCGQGSLAPNGRYIVYIKDVR